MAGAVDVRELRRAFGPVTAVDGASWGAAAGEVTALLGPNGAGKTTTIECLEGLGRPDAGEVRVLGVDPWRAPADHRARVGVMLQDGGLPTTVRPLRLLEHLADLYAGPRRVDELVARLGIDGFAGTTVRRMSGGQRQRVALAAALLARPEVAVLDEPTAGLDPHARLDVWALLREEADRGCGGRRDDPLLRGGRADRRPRRHHGGGPRRRRRHAGRRPRGPHARGRLLLPDDAGGAVTTAAPPRRRVLSRAAFETRTLLANGEQLLVSLLLPALALARADPRLGPRPRSRAARADLALAGTLALAVVSTAFTGQAIATGFDRRAGVLRQLGSTPLGRGGLLAGKLLAVLAVLVVQVVVLGLLGVALGARPAVGGPRSRPSLSLLLGAAAFVALGLLLAGALRAEAVLAVANLVWVLLLGLGTLVPTTSLPAPLDDRGAPAAVGCPRRRRARRPRRRRLGLGRLGRAGPVGAGSRPAGSAVVPVVGLRRTEPSRGLSSVARGHDGSVHDAP